MNIFLIRIMKTNDLNSVHQLQNKLFKQDNDDYSFDLISALFHSSKSQYVAVVNDNIVGYILSCENLKYLDGEKKCDLLPQ